MRDDLKGLDERSRDVLASVVVQYIRSAAPVSSRQLTKGGHFALSSASLRNAMADLEELGFLTHPHVSAGRVPTDRGYRAFVSNLMTAQRPTPEDRVWIEKELAPPDAFELDRFLHAASRVLSRLTGEAGLAAMAATATFVLQTVHFTRVAERRVLVVQVAESGLVDSRVTDTREDYAPEELDAISRRLTTDYAGRTLEEIRELLVAALSEEKVRFDRTLARTLELGTNAFAAVRGGAGAVVVEGAETMLEKPEFQHDVEALKRMFRAFDDKVRLVNLLSDCLEHGGPRVVIGSESALTDETQSAVVATAFRAGGRAAGVLGVIGPRRMEYSRVVPMVEELGRYVTRRLTEGAG